MSANDEILNALTRHQIFVLRYARGRENRASEFISDLLMSVIERLDQPGLTPFARQRILQQGGDLYLYMLAEQGSYRDELLEALLDFGEYEAEFNAGVIGQVGVTAAIPTAGQIYTAMNTSLINIPGSPGYSMSRMLQDFDRHTLKQIELQIREAAVFGYTNKELTKKILDLEPTLGRGAATVARTATNHVSNQTRKLSMQENDDVIEGYEWVSTLDSRTSLVCMARDGTIYRDFDKDPKPPAHFNCRSTITMVVNPEYDLGPEGGTRPSVGPDGVEQVKASTTYSDWLKRQPASFQDKVLGPGRAKLFREGNITLDKFIDEQGRPITLEQLRGIDGQFVPKAPPVASTAAGESFTFTNPSKPIGDINPRRMEEIQLVSAARAKARLEAWAKNNAEDERHWGYTRFRNRQARAEWKDLEKFDDDTVIALEACLDDLDRLCDAFNIPRLRGFKYRGGRANADMGDAIMGINPTTMGARVKGLSKGERRVRDQSKLSTWEDDGTTYWFRGRPWSARSYQDNDFDQFRSTIFHELGHHVHQMYGAKADVMYIYKKLPPVEKMFRSGKYSIKKRRSSSEYGDTNYEEWFAENFALYFLGRRDKADKLFIELIEKLLEGAYG